VPEGSRDVKIALLSQLLMKECLSREEIANSKSDTIKTLSIQAVNSNLEPQGIFKIKIIYGILKISTLNLNTEALPWLARKNFTKKVLEGNYRKLIPPH